jgi:Spy/CpxP family protein refolding chaperone
MNKIIKKLLIALMNMSMLSVQAQRDSMPAERMAYRLKNYLSLSEDQTLRVKEVYRAQGQKMKAIRQSTDSTDVKRTALKQLGIETDQQLMPLLTSEQQKGYIEVKGKIKEALRYKMQQSRQKGGKRHKTASGEDDF